MDTVKLKVKDSDLADSIRTALLTKNSLTTKSRDEGGRRVRFATGYKNQIEGHINGHHICYGYGPRSQYRSPGLLQFHLSHYPTWADFNAWARALFGEHFKGILERCPVERLDVCLDLALPYETITKSISLPGCKTHERWASDGGRTLYLGEIPSRFRVYEKRGLLSTNIDYNSGEILDPARRLNCIRIELELHKGKVPIKTLSELEKLRGTNPFEKLRFSDCSSLVQTVHLENSHLVQHFLKRVGEVGFAPAKKEFNAGGNFSRTIAPFIAPLNLDLARAWQTRMTRFFGGISIESREAA